MNIVISTFKRWQLDVFHGVSAARPRSCHGDLCHPLNRRDQRPDPFGCILDRCVLHAPSTTCSQLIAA